ncbi:MAG: DUF3299 domain-containing protein [Marinibacterium sp.]|nr:DUF3299 domain-containing protein [Marinibacterium sp.]
MALSLAAIGVAGRVRADAVVTLDWADLVPEGEGMTMQRLRQLGVVEHGQLDTPFSQDTGGQITTEFDGRQVRIPGYVVPLDYDGTGVSSLLLVPYVGACIHVPPPPPNQLIFVTTAEPYEFRGLFEPVFVTGTFASRASATQLAEVGYSIEADLIEPYG